MATTVFQDQFNGGSSVDLVSRTPNIGTSWAEWIDSNGSMTIQQNAGGYAEPTGGGNSRRIIYSATPSPALGGGDVDVALTVSVFNTSGPDDPVFVIARGVDTSNYYAAGARGGAATSGAFIGKVSSGTGSILTSDTTSWANGDVLLFELRGTTLKLYRNGVEILSTTDSDFSAAGVVGFGYGNAVSAFDDVLAHRCSLFEVVDQNTGGSSFVPFPRPRGLSAGAHILRGGMN